MTSKYLKFSILSHFYIAFILDGLQRLSGLFLVELLQSMNVQRQSAALPFTLSWAVANIMSSLSDVLLRNKNSEYIKLLGVLMTAMGAALCFFSTNTFVVILSWGFIFGTGYGLSFPHLFKHLRIDNSCKAATLLQATQSLGATIMPFILQMISYHYSLQGFYLIVSGIILNYVPLFLAAIYNIELNIPTIKWKIRKRSRQYFVTKQTVKETVLNENFNNSLEPDLILKISQSKGSQNDKICIKETIDTSEKEVIHIGRKRSETRCNDLQGLPVDMRILPRNKTYSEIVQDIQNYEKVRKLFEGSFSSSEIIEEEIGNTESIEFSLQDNKQISDTNVIVHEMENNSLNKDRHEKHEDPNIQKLKKDSRTSNDVNTNLSRENLSENFSFRNGDQVSNERETKQTMLNKAASETTGEISTLNHKTLYEIPGNKKSTDCHSKNISTRFHSDLENVNTPTNKTTPKMNDTIISNLEHAISEKQTQDSVTELHKINEESVAKCSQKNSREYVNSFDSKNIDIRNGTFQNCTEQYALIFDKRRENEIEQITSHPEENLVKLPILLQKSKHQSGHHQNLDSEARHLKLSPECLKNKSKLDIPVSIKIHVVECTFEGDEDNWFKTLKTDDLKPQKNTYRKHSKSMIQGTYDNIDFTTLNSPSTFENVSELTKPKLSKITSITENINLDNRTPSLSRMKQEQGRINYTLSKVKQCFKFIDEISVPACLSIILISMIFEFNLVTLITIFADFGNEVNTNSADFKWILIAFGVGGLTGKFCCCKISRTIPEKSHAIGVILFLLTGLSTAGILFSPNLNWLAGFYFILGALEGGISYTIPKFILEYIDMDMHSKLLVSMKFLSGVAVLSIPFAIGLSRDQLGDYEFLLETLSCSSVLCAFIAYFLPHLSRKSNKKILRYSRNDKN